MITGGKNGICKLSSNFTQSYLHFLPANAFGKDMDPFLPLNPGLTGVSSNSSEQPVNEKDDSEFKLWRRQQETTPLSLQVIVMVIQFTDQGSCEELWSFES